MNVSPLLQRETENGREAASLQAAVAGALQGIGATVPMTAVMLLIDRQLPAYEQLPAPQEPLLITRELLRRAGLLRLLSAEDVRRLAWVAHFAYGAACGGVYGGAGAARGAPDEQFARKRSVMQIAARGSLFGFAVWAFGYCGWLPALGILPTPPQRPLGRNLLLIAAHLVWGSVAASLHASTPVANSEPRLRSSN